MTHGKKRLVVLRTVASRAAPVKEKVQTHLHTHTYTYTYTHSFTLIISILSLPPVWFGMLPFPHPFLYHPYTLIGTASHIREPSVATVHPRLYTAS